MEKKIKIEPISEKLLDAEGLKQEKEIFKLKQSKYWIEKGMAVFHIDYPNLKMRVDQVKKETKEIRVGDSVEKKTFIIGVDVHWIDIDNRAQKARFNTRELREWVENKS